jgi:acyl dehydratase
MLYFEDIQPGDSMRSPTYAIDHNEMIEFARRWDPAPIHVDPDAAEAAIGGLTASGTVPTTIDAFGHRLYVVNARFTTPPTATTPYWITQFTA